MGYVSCSLYIPDELKRVVVVKWPGESGRVVDGSRGTLSLGRQHGTEETPVVADNASLSSDVVDHYSEIDNSRRPSYESLDPNSMEQPRPHPVYDQLDETNKTVVPSAEGIASYSS